MSDQATTRHPSIALVILNWNGADDTLECLASLRASTAPVHSIVVDNGSTGDDIERIRASGLADALIATGSNLGYAEGNNRGLRHALEAQESFEVVGVLNNDTVVEPDCFGGLAGLLDDVRCGALAPRTMYFDQPDRVWFAGGVVDRGWPRHLQPNELGDPGRPLEPSDWLTGCCIVARAETWREVGLFDPRYYLIFEDSEWSARARAEGVELLVANECIIRHRVSRSFRAESTSLIGAFYYVRNGLRFERQYAPRYLPRFLVNNLIRPTLSDISRLTLRRDLGFRWLGLAAFVTGQTGRAPRYVSRWAVEEHNPPA